MSQPLARWDVHFFFCQQAQPDPKEKFVVISYVEADWFYGFFINSEVKQFIIKQNLQPCMAPIARATHGFLSHNSWVDCTGAYTFPITLLTPETYRGALDQATIQAVLDAVTICPRIRTGQQKRILAP